MADCVSPAPVTGLVAGAHTFKIQATDLAGNKSDIYSYAWTVDLTAPTVTISAAPQPVTGSAAASFSFSGTGIVKYECDLDGSGFSTCTSPKTYSALAEGKHAFKVRGTSTAGNVSSPAAFSWIIDVTPPTAPTIVTSVQPATVDPNAVFLFSSSDTLSGLKDYQCSLDGSAFATCDSPKSYTPGSGPHKFSVKAMDNVGNVSLASSFSWVIDNQGPTITFTAKPNPQHISETSNFAFTVTDSSGVKSVQCRYSSPALKTIYTDCASGTATYELPPGRYLFEIAAVDKAGNPSIASYRWEIEDGVGTVVRWKSIVGHQDGICGITTGNQVVCSGTSSTIPQVVPGLDGAKQLSGSYYVCAVTAAGTVSCFLPTYPGLGPTEVPGLSDVAAVSDGGGGARCALINGGTVRCWGKNTSGQLGNGTTTDSTTPVMVSGITGATAIQIRGSNACAIVTGGAVKCWGENTAGQLGNGTTTTLSSVPVDVVGITGAVQVITGATSCALLSSGVVKCWGFGANGLLGNGTTAASSVPVTVTGLSGATSIAYGYGNICAVPSDGSLKCWGDISGTYKQTYVSTPTDIGGFSGLKNVAEGFHTCVLQTDGAARCGGYNWVGNLSNNSATHSLVPVRSVWIRNISSIAAGNGLSSCGLTTGKTVQCWGANDNGILGNGTRGGASLVPVDVTNLSNIKQVSVGATHACALTGTDTVKCWGYNFAGMLGTGNTTPSSTPTDVIGLSGVKSISAGGFNSCALLADETVKCWGVGFNTSFAYVNSLTPTAITGLNGIKMIATGPGINSYYGCGVDGSGNVICWSNRQGDPNLQVANLTGVKQIVVGSEVACAITSAGGVKCWGSNSNGSLGINSSNMLSMYQTSAVDVIGLSSRVTKLTASHASVCALKDTGQVFCWGYNQYAQLGIGTTSTALVPTLVTPNFAVTDIGLSSNALYLVHPDGRVSTSGVKAIEYSEPAGVIKQ